MSAAQTKLPTDRPDHNDWWDRGSLVVKTHGEDAGALRVDYNFGAERTAEEIQEHARLVLPGEYDPLKPTEVDNEGPGRFSVSFFSSDIANAGHLPADATLQWANDPDSQLSRKLPVIDADLVQKRAGQHTAEVHPTVDRYPKTLMFAAVLGVIAIGLGAVIYFLITSN